MCSGKVDEAAASMHVPFKYSDVHAYCISNDSNMRAAGRVAFGFCCGLCVA